MLPPQFIFCFIESYRECFSSCSIFICCTLVVRKHYIEFSCLNAADGYKAFKKMQDILLKRRAIKDKMSFAQVLEQRKIDKSSLQAVLTYLENMGNRSYEVRADTGLFSDLTDITPNK